ncbi:MAG: Mur ligase domain-containing protein, partial [Pseudomonadota bacterium]
MGARTVSDLDELNLLGDAALMGPERLPAPITGLSVDSRKVAPGHLFASLPGTLAHGIRFIDQAIERGAVAVLTDAVGVSEILARWPDPALTVLVCRDPRAALARAAAAWHRAQPE